MRELARQDRGRRRARAGARRHRHREPRPRGAGRCCAELAPHTGRAHRGRHHRPARRGQEHAGGRARRARCAQEGKTVGIIAVDPTSRVSGGAILGDRIRMQRHHADPGIFIRSMATRGSLGGLARATARPGPPARRGGLRLRPDRDRRAWGRTKSKSPAWRRSPSWCWCPAWATTCRRSRRASWRSPTSSSSTRRTSPAPSAWSARCSAMLSLAQRPTSRPAIVRTVATEGAGIPELARRRSVRRSATHPVPGPRPPAPVSHRPPRHRRPFARRGPAFYRDTLGMTAGERETVEQEKVNVAMLPAGESRIELLEATGAGFAGREVRRQARRRPAPRRPAGAGPGRRGGAAARGGRAAAERAAPGRRRASLRVRAPRLHRRRAAGTDSGERI